MNDRPIGMDVKDAPECTPGDYTSMRLVDSVPNLVGGNNLLFRGGMPLDSCGNFDLAGLDAAFRTLHAQTPEHYYLVDISLVFDDDAGLKVEREFFTNPVPVPGIGNQPNQTGQLVWWPTYGSLRCYYQTAPGERDRLVRTFDEWLPDTLFRRTETLRYMLETSWAPGPTPYDPGYNLPGKPCPPCVFYVHCSGGCDRTSELIGAYRLRYQGFNWLEMNKELPCRRPNPSSSLPSMGCSNYRALQWYAIWLNRTFGFALAPYGDTGCYDGGQQPWHPCSPSAQIEQ